MPGHAHDHHRPASSVQVAVQVALAGGDLEQDVFLTEKLRPEVKWLHHP